MAKRVITTPGGRPVYVIRRNHPVARVFGRLCLASLLVGPPLALPKPEVYFLAPVIILGELVILRKIRWTTGDNRNGKKQGEDHGDSP